MINRKVNEFRKNERVWWGEYRRITGRTISTLGRGSSMIVRIGEPKRVGGRGVDLNDTIILDPGFFENILCISIEDWWRQ